MGGDDSVNDLRRMEQPEVQRRRQHRVRHLPLVGEHGVLVGAELRQSRLDELLEADQGLSAVDRPGAVGCRAPDVGPEIGDDGPVDVVQLEAGEGRPGPAVLGRGFPVVVVEVPAAADRFTIRFDQHIEPGALPAIEVLHLEGFPVADPAGEILVVTEELTVGNELDAGLGQHGPPIPAHGLHGDDPANVVIRSVGSKPGREGCGPAMIHLEALGPQLCCEVRHGRQHQMKAPAMPTFATDFGVARHQQNPAVTRLAIGEWTDGSVQLVSEHPDGVELRHGLTAPYEGSGWRNRPTGIGASQRTKARCQDGDAPRAHPSPPRRNPVKSLRPSRWPRSSSGRPG
jgi:hypothetical protein